jgi:hypothetical protein
MGKSPEAWAALAAWLCVASSCVGCTREDHARLPLTAPIPEAFPATTGSSSGSPHFLDHREALLAALGVAAPTPDEEAVSHVGTATLRTGRHETRLERTA